MLLIMGCCASEQRVVTKDGLVAGVKTCIESNNVERLSGYALLYENMRKPEDVELQFVEIIKINSISLTSLAYALYLGHYKVFRYLHQKLKQSVVLIENSFRAQGMTGIEIICKKQYMDLLDYYLPVYLENYSKFNECSTIPNTVFNLVRSGNIAVLSKIDFHTKEVENIPKELDIHAIDDSTGNNTFLEACKTCNLPCIKFLVANCKVSSSHQNHQKLSGSDLLLQSGDSQEKIQICLDNLLSLTSQN